MATTAIPESILEPIQSTYGSALIGLWIDLVIYGFVTCQTYIYFNNFPEDKMRTKILVISLWVLTTVHGLLTCHSEYYHMIANVLNAPVYGQNVWSLTASVSVHVIVVTICLIYFTIIVYEIVGKKTRYWICPLLACAVLAHVGFGIAVVVKLARTKLLEEIAKYSRTCIMPLGISQVIADILIATSLCVILFKKRTTGTFKRTNGVLKTLMIYAFNRCILTSFVTMVEFLTSAIVPNQFWYIACEFIITDLYVCSILASLNARSQFRSPDGTALNEPLPLQLESLSSERSRHDLQVSNSSKHHEYDSGEFEATPDQSKQHIQVRVDVNSFGVRS